MIRATMRHGQDVIDVPTADHDAGCGGRVSERLCRHRGAASLETSTRSALRIERTCIDSGCDHDRDLRVLPARFRSSEDLRSLIERGSFAVPVTTQPCELGLGADEVMFRLAVALGDLGPPVLGGF